MSREGVPSFARQRRSLRKNFQPGRFGTHLSAQVRCHQTVIQVSQLDVTLSPMEGSVDNLAKVEYARLAELVKEIERLLAAAAPGEVGIRLTSLAHSAKSRMEDIQAELVLSEATKNDEKVKLAAGVAHLAALETKLGEEERHQYGEFLKLSYFTKVNFADLDRFYTHTWDRLSERGKDEMSARVWEGVKQKEYTFDELPGAVREKESERIYQQLTGKIESSTSLQTVPKETRTEFVREFESKNEDATTRILSGEGFSGYTPGRKRIATPKAESLTGEIQSADEQLRAKLKNEEISLSGITVFEVDTVSVPTVSGGDTASPAQKR